MRAEGEENGRERIVKMVFDLSVRNFIQYLNCLRCPTIITSISSKINETWLLLSL